MHRDEFNARLEILRGHTSWMLRRLNKDRRANRDQIKVLAELQALQADPNADRREIQCCKDWLYKYGPRASHTQVQLTPRQQTVKTLLGSAAPGSVNRKDKRSAFRKFLGDF